MGKPEITVRRASADDLAGIIDVASAALGWAPGEPHEQLFRWKHLDNPFGESPMWVAESDGRLAGFRAFMRWELDGPDACRWRAVRAVDTATHPDFQRMGIFSKLTSGAVDEMRDEGVDIVFNTPNDQSRPGYLKMGWIDVGRLPVSFRPTSPAALARMAKARTPADKWSEPTTTGVSAIDALADRDAVAALASAARNGDTGSALTTPLDAAFLAWRYGLEPLHYRAWVGLGGRGDLDEGVVLFRRRRRGTAIECSVGHVLVPDGDPVAARRLLGSMAKEVEADYLIRIGAPDPRGGFAPLPNQGPRLTARTVKTDPPADLAAWSFQLGDVELL
ncbi:MAG: GNAT family N-acetyltransferase [Acidimicrobiales bacterium]